MEIKITVDQDGRIGVDGPLGDKIGMYGILEVVKDIVRTYKEEDKPLIVPVKPLIGA